MHVLFSVYDLLIFPASPRPDRDGVVGVIPAGRPLARVLDTHPDTALAETQELADAATELSQDVGLFNVPLIGDIDGGGRHRPDVTQGLSRQVRYCPAPAENIIIYSYVNIL